jgi:hypothetical protein
VTRRDVVQLTWADLIDGAVLEFHAQDARQHVAHVAGLAEFATDQVLELLGPTPAHRLRAPRQGEPSHRNQFLGGARQLNDLVRLVEVAADPRHDPTTL